MNHIVSILLIPLFMLGHVLPHSHAGIGVVEPDGHSVRPHIHVSGDHHHSHDVSDHAASDHEHDHTGQCEAEHSEDSATDTLSVPTDHDSDAIYLADGEWTASRTVVASQIDSASLVWTSLASSVDRDGCIACRFGDPPDRYAGLPVYLLIASLRL